MAGIRSRQRGELETLIMKVLWSARSPLTARDVRSQLSAQEPVPAYTTVITVLDRLVDKGLVNREAESPRRIRFVAAQTEDAQASDTMLHTLETVGDRRAALLRFAGELDDTDVDVLRRALKAR